MVALLGVLSLLLLLPGVIVILLRHLDNAEENEKKEVQKLINEALRSS